MKFVRSFKLQNRQRAALLPGDPPQPVTKRSPSSGPRPPRDPAVLELVAASKHDAAVGIVKSPATIASGGGVRRDTSPSKAQQSSTVALRPSRSVELDGPGYLRLADVLRVLAVSRATYYAKMKQGIYPASVALGPRARGWTRASIRELVARIEAGELSGS